MAPTRNGSVSVEFACRDCRDGRHGCAGIWEGLGIKIRCTCYCRPIEQEEQTDSVKGDAGHHATSLTPTAPTPPFLHKAARDSINILEVHQPANSTRRSGLP